MAPVGGATFAADYMTVVLQQCAQRDAVVQAQCARALCCMCCVACARRSGHTFSGWLRASVPPRRAGRRGGGQEPPPRGRPQGEPGDLTPCWELWAGWPHAEGVRTGPQARAEMSADGSVKRGVWLIQPRAGRAGIEAKAGRPSGAVAGANMAPVGGATLAADYMTVVLLPRALWGQYYCIYRQ